MLRKQRMETILYQHLQPAVMEVYNESHKHHVPEHSETHFKLVIVSGQFDALSRIERHRLVNRLLADELNSGLHALSLHLHTPSEWDSRQGQTTASPSCRDGYHH